MIANVLAKDRKQIWDMQILPIVFVAIEICAKQNTTSRNITPKIIEGSLDHIKSNNILYKSWFRHSMPA